MHGALVMEIRSARQFKVHIELAIKELSSALFVAQRVYTAEEFVTISKRMAHMISAVDGVLHDFIYSKHPELNDLGNGPKGS
jgi:hypothetical protein